MNSEKKLGQEPAFPMDFEQRNDFQLGMSKRFYAACAMKNDFEDLSLRLKEIIVGEDVPRNNNPGKPVAKDTIEYAKWIAKGRARWKYMQVDELLKQENQ